MVTCLLAALLLPCGKVSGAHPLEVFLPDGETATRLQPVIDHLESDLFSEREAASHALLALPALPGFVRELAVKEPRPESRIRLREVVAAFPVETENGRLTGVLRTIETQAAKGLLDAIVRVMQRGIWSPDSEALHAAARTTATRADLRLIQRCLGDGSPAIRRLGAAALGGLPPGDSNNLLAGLLSDADASTAMLAASALAARKDRRCLAAFARLLDAEDFQTRYHSHAALRGLSGRDFGYDPSAAATERGAAAGKWRKWAESGKAAITGAMPRDPAIALFNGRNLQGWEVCLGGKASGTSSAWEVKDGTIHCNGGEPGDLWTTARFKNYVLDFEYKVDANGADSGLGLLLTEAGERGANGPGYLEIQLLPGKAGDIYQIGDIKLEVSGGPVRFTGPRIAEVADPAGQWHKVKLTVRDGAVRIEINGILVNWTTKGPSGAGRILLRNELDPISFRGFLLHPLDSAP
jgi:hypothetical protein